MTQNTEKTQKAKQIGAVVSTLMRVVSGLFNMLSKPGFVLSVLVACISALILLFAAKNESMTPSLTFLMVSLVFFAAAIANEVITRRKWEENLSLYLNRLENRVGNLSNEHDKATSDNKKLTIAISGLIHQLKEKSTATEQRNLTDILLHIQEQSPLHKNTTAQIASVSSKSYDLPSFDDDTSTDEELSDAVVSELISTAVRHDRVDVFLQPIVRLPQRKIAFYEVYARLRAKKGGYLSASRYLDLARQDHLVPAIDNLLFMRAIQLIRRQKGADHQSIAYFLNVNADTFNNSALMADLVDFLGDNRHLAGKLVLEIAQKDFNALNASIWPVLKSLSQMGVRFSMDQVTLLDIDVTKLLSYNVVFVKIDSALLLDTLSSKVGQRAFMTLKKDFDNSGVDLIVQKIETEQNLRDILEYNIDFGQGYLFGEPEQSQKRAA